MLLQAEAWSTQQETRYINYLLTYLLTRRQRRWSWQVHSYLIRLLTSLVKTQERTHTHNELDASTKVHGPMYTGYNKHVSW